MVRFPGGREQSQDHGLRRKLAIIQALIFVLPFLIAFYLIYEKNLFLQASELAVVSLVLVLVLGGLVLLRQIFDRILHIASSLRKAETGEAAPVDLRGGAAELEAISVSLNRVMDRMEKTTGTLDQKILELTAIRELYEEARKSLDIEALLNMVLEKAMSVTGASVGSLVVPDEGVNRYHLLHTKGIERGLPDGSGIEIGDSFLKQVVADGKALLVQDIEHDSRTLKANDARYGPPSFMSVPILIENRVAAILNLAKKSSGELFTENDLQATSVMLDEIGFALENASLHARIKEHLREILQQNKMLEQEIAERKTAEEQLRRIQDGLESIVQERTAALVATNVALEKEIEEGKKLESELLQARKMEAIGTLAGGIAHDFNNVLTNIGGNASLMLMSLDADHPHREYLLQIEESVQSAAGLTKQLLGFARKGKFNVQATNLGELVRRSAALFSRTRKDIVFHESYQEDPWIVEVDRGQIEQVLLNLFVNAEQAMPGRGEIRLATQNALLDGQEAGLRKAKPGRYLKLTVTDTGVGMDERTKERIFEPFFTTKEMGRGTGLGLSSVYGIIRGHAGFIDVSSEKGKGTTFHVYLPASDKEETALERPAVEKAYAGCETILLVDDEQRVATVCRTMLEKLGYRVLVAINGQEAVDRYRAFKQEIDLVLLDMIMPGMGGDQAFDLLKAINPEVRVVLATGYDSMKGKTVALMERGCRGLIQKPFDVYTLSRTIREVLDGTADAPSPPASSLA